MRSAKQREADAQQPPLLARRALALAEGRQVERARAQLDRLVVGALVDRQAGRADVGEGAGRDQVAQADLVDLELEPQRRLLQQPLHRQHHLRPRDAAVGRHRRLVGGDRAGAAAVVRHAVGAEHLGRRHQRLDAAGERVRRVRADVGHDVGVDGQHAALGVEARADVEALLVALEAGQQALDAVLDPLDRRVHGAGGDAHEHLLARDDALLAEAAADVRRHDAHAVLVDAEHARHRGADDVRDLRRGVQDDALAAALPLGEAGAALERHRGQAAGGELRLDDELGAGQHVVHLGVVGERHVEQHVGLELIVHARRVVLERRLDRADRVVGLVVDDDQLGRVLRGVRGVGDHHGDRLARVAHALGREHRELDGHELRPVEPRHERLELAEVGGGQHGAHAGRLRRLGGVDALDPRRTVGRAGEGDVQHAGGADVVDEGGVAGQVAAVLDPRHRAADPAPAEGGGLSVHPSTASSSARRTSVAASRRR